MKRIVTHIGPDLDACCATWLLRRNMPGFAGAELAFVPAGETYEGLPADDNPDIVHVDTGFGMFDHHQASDRSSATQKVYEHLRERGLFKVWDVQALERLTEFVTTIDNFGEVDFPDPIADVYDFGLGTYLDQIKQFVGSDANIVSHAEVALEAILQVIKNKIKAEEEIEKKGFITQTSFGKTLFIESKNEEVLKIALKKRFPLVVRKDPMRGSVRIKTLPYPEYDLTQIAEILKERDPKASWFLHSSKHMLLNGSSKNPGLIASRLTISELVAIMKTL